MSNPPRSNDHRNPNDSLPPLEEILAQAKAAAEAEGLTETDFLPESQVAHGDLAGQPVFYTVDHLIRGKRVLETRIKLRNVVTGKVSTYSVTEAKFVSHSTGKVLGQP